MKKTRYDIERAPSIEVSRYHLERSPGKTFAYFKWSIPWSLLEWQSAKWSRELASPYWISGLKGNWHNSMWLFSEILSDSIRLITAGPNVTRLMLFISQPVNILTSLLGSFRPPCDFALTITGEGRASHFDLYMLGTHGLWAVSVL